MQSSAAVAQPFTVDAQDGQARSGTLRLANMEVHTPAALLYTRRGTPVSLSGDMLQWLRPMAQAVQLNAMQFLNFPDLETIKKFGKGAHDFLALQDWPLIATQRDPTFYEYGASASSADAVYVTIHSGGKMVTPEMYINTIQVRPCKPRFVTDIRLDW